MITRAQFYQWRSMILDEFNNLEMIMNMIISHKYFGRGDRNFFFVVLNSPYFTFQLRSDIIKKIKVNFDRDIESKLNRMGNIRNIFAHIIPGYFDEGEEMKFENLGWFPNPKNPSEKLNFEETFKEFFLLRDEVLPYLNNIWNELGITPIKDDSKKKEKI